MSKPLSEPPPLPPENRRGSWLSIVLAVVLAMASFIGLWFLTLGSFGPVLLVVGMMFFIVTFHYLVWGWWLGKVIQQASEEEEPASFPQVLADHSGNAPRPPTE